MKFKPNDVDVKTLFKTYPTFNIPIFQRDYSWDSIYYSRFLDDIVNGISTDKNNILETNAYFIGTMVFTGSGKNNEPVDVVDGQQRLTVITILLSVISEKLANIGEQGLADATFKYVKDTDDNNEPLRHLVSGTSYPYFDGFVQSQDKRAVLQPSSEEEENIKQTYEFFNTALEYSKLKNGFQIFQNVEYKNVLIAIRDQLLSSILIAIITPDRDSAYMIFEILNAKGKNLASIDLIKNIIFEKLHGDKNGAVGKAEKLWENSKETLRTRNNSVGLATFYRHFWISKYAKVTNAKLYDSFKDYIKPRDKERYLSFLNELNQASHEYIRIISPQLGDYQDKKQYQWLVQSLKAFNGVFGVVQTRIALLALLDVKKRDLVSTPAFKDAILYLENFVLAYTGICKNQANIYESSFSKLAIELRNSTSKDQTNRIIKEKLIDKLDNRFPKYEEFEEGFVRLSYTKKPQSENVITKYILNKISQYISNRDHFWDDSSIEHIINENVEIVGTMNIGNLICLEEILNNNADNLDFREKTEIYSRSKYKEVADFLVNYSDFSLDLSEQRAKDLSNFYYEKILGRTK